jgi:hypothetical protein
MFSKTALTTISAFFKVIFSALARASMSCDLFIPLNSLGACAEALTGAGSSIAYKLI